MNNKILNLTIAIGQVIRSFLIFIFIIVIFIALLHLVNSEALPFLRYENGSFNLSGQGSPMDEIGFKLDGWFLIWTFFKMSSTILCSLLIVTQILKIIRSIKSLETFKQNNINAFRKIAMIFLVIFGLNIFDVTQSSEQLQMTFQLSLEHLLAAAACYILSEVFKEGNKLMEDNQLTI